MSAPMPPDLLPPLILTLLLDDASQAWFDALRHRYFPADRLQVGAHVTMFHALPGADEPAVVQVVADCCGRLAAMPVEIAGLRFLGRGVAFALRAPEAVALRGRLRAGFAHALTAQDAASWSPHVTIQNKVAPAQARQTQADLAALAWPGGVLGTGIGVWRYLGGPWAHLRSVPFGLETAGCARTK